MIFLEEITVWNVNYAVPNHTYYLSDDRRRAVGYIPYGSKKLVKFGKPMSFDVRGRKFKPVNRAAEDDTVYFPKTESAAPAAANVITVEGSSGKKYFISKIGNRYSCSCPGFQFRNKCKHVDQLSK